MNCIDCRNKLKWWEILCLFIEYHIEINQIGDINKKPLKIHKLGLNCKKCARLFEFGVNR